MNKQFQIKLSRIDFGQLLDGLEIRAESWERTAEFLENGYLADNSFIIEECNNVDEARSISSHYRALIADIRKQIKEQKGL